MSLFSTKPKAKAEPNPAAKPEKDKLNWVVGVKKSTQVAGPAKAGAGNAAIADLALKMIQEGILVVDRNLTVRYLNPAAVEMSGIGKAADAVGLDIGSVIRLEKIDGEKIEDADNKFTLALGKNQAFESRDFVVISRQGDRKTPVMITVVPSGNATMDRIVTIRNIAKELEEEGAQSEFISTASHEMRTPVASIEGYLGLALNPQTATIDARARQYIESAHSASKRLGNLFKDLLDVTKLDDKRARVHLVPIELNSFVKKFADEYSIRFKEKNLSYSFGADGGKKAKFGGGKTLEQVVYALVDVDFLGEIISNLLENALKYTPNGGAVWVNVQGDGDRALINVTDTGIGIAAEDLQHIFQKFYRADNSQTRTIGGTGLGLYLVKQRVEALDGRVWAESAFGEGSTFYVSLPRITAEEFERRQASLKNRAAVEAFEEQSRRQNSANQAAAAKMNALEAEARERELIAAQRQQQQEQAAALQRQRAITVAPRLQPNLMPIPPQAQAFTQAQTVPQMQTAPQTPTVSQMQAVPQTQTVPQMQTMPQMQTIPQTQTAPQMQTPAQMQMMQIPVPSTMQAQVPPQMPAQALPQTPVLPQAPEQAPAQVLPQTPVLPQAQVFPQAQFASPAFPQAQVLPQQMQTPAPQQVQTPAQMPAQAQTPLLQGEKISLHPSRTQEEPANPTILPETEET